jgi:hypothetical protein
MLEPAWIELMRTRSPHRGSLFLVVAVGITIGAHPPAEAQLSFTNALTYDTSVLSSRDWDAMGRSYLTQVFRGSMALVFPDREPITDSSAIERWITSGKPLRGVAFPGITGDTAAAWAMAKQVALVNQRRDKKAKPVLAVNSGWTDWWSGVGHLTELYTLRGAIDSGRAYTADSISSTVAGMLKKRMERRRERGKQPEAIGIVGHSAGGYYSANVSWLLGDQHRRQLQVYNIGIAARLPDSVKATQIVGTSDTIGQVNSDSSALARRSTRIEDGLSHLGGELWTMGDSFSKKRWTIQPLADIFDRPRPKGGKIDKVSRDTYLRSWAKELGRRSKKFQQLADRHRQEHGVSKVVSIKLDHDAKMLDLASRRHVAIADLLKARQRKDTKGLTTARTKLRALRRERHLAAAEAGRQSKAVTRGMMTDSMKFMTTMANETMAGCTPMGLWQKAMQGTAASMTWGLRMSQMMMSNPLVNPWAAFFGSGSKGSCDRGRSSRSRLRSRGR